MVGFPAFFVYVQGIRARALSEGSCKYFQRLLVDFGAQKIHRPGLQAPWRCIHGLHTVMRLWFLPRLRLLSGWQDR